jgi:hypothetical protein
MNNFEIKTEQTPPEEMDRIAIEWLKRCAEIEGPAAVVALPQEAWNTLYETLQMDAESSAFDLDLHREINAALEQVNAKRPAFQPVSYLEPLVGQLY